MGVVKTQQLVLGGGYCSTYVDNGSNKDNVDDQQSRISSMSGPDFSFHLDANIVDNNGLSEEIKYVGVEIGQI